MSTIELVARSPSTADKTIRGNEFVSGEGFIASDEITARDRTSAVDEILPFGPYRALPVEQVAVMDPAYLAGLVKAEVGPAAFRAVAARALLTSGRYVAADEIVASPMSLRPWAAVLGAGVVLAVLLGLADTVGLGGLPAPAPLAARSHRDGRWPTTSAPARAGNGGAAAVTVRNRWSREHLRRQRRPPRDPPPAPQALRPPTPAWPACQAPSPPSPPATTWTRSRPWPFGSWRRRTPAR